MPNQQGNPTIQCKIYQESYVVLNKIKQKIDQSKSIGIKAKYAEELAEEAGCLIDCKQYDDEKQDCNYCFLKSELNKRTAELIKINAKRLSL